MQSGLAAERLFRPRSVSVIGAGTLTGRQVLRNLRAGGFAGTIDAVEQAGGPSAGADLSILCLPAAGVVPALAVLGSRGERAPSGRLASAAGHAATVIVTSSIDATALRDAARDAGVRVLGPGSFGVIVPGLGLDASLSHIPARPGHLALVSQSAALCRAVVDWAEPNGVGFSHIVGVGGGADLGFDVVLDWLSRDQGTGAVLLDIRSIGEPRAFVSAARAASRLRPIVAIRAGGRLQDPSGRAELAFNAALRRAGVLVVERFADLLAAAETLTRAPQARSEGLAIVTNALGPGRMAADAALRAGLPLADLPGYAREVLGHSLGSEVIQAPCGGLVYAGIAAPVRLAETTAMLAALPQVGGIVVIMAPTGFGGPDGDEAGIAALQAARASVGVPLIACVMGEATGAARRRRLADAGLPVFATPEQAVRGFVHLVEDRRVRLAARELPASRVLAVAPDHRAARRTLDDARSSGRETLSPRQSARLCRAYGIVAEAGPEIEVLAADDAMVGPVIELRSVRGAARAVELPPLNLALAAGLIARADRRLAKWDALAERLVQVSQLLVEYPQIASLSVRFGGRALAAEVTLRPEGSAQRLAIAPYPVELAHEWTAGGRRFTVRPIRPEDAAAHGRLIERASPEDLRLRFFHAVRALSPEQMARMTQVDYEREMALIAVDDAGETAGVCRLVRLGGDARQGEFAVLVQPQAKGLGLARHLLACLCGWARGQGLTQIVGQVLAENAPMLGLVRALGFTLHVCETDRTIIEATLRI